MIIAALAVVGGPAAADSPDLQETTCTGDSPDRCGQAVAVLIGASFEPDATTVAVGAPSFTSAEESEGAVYLFELAEGGMQYASTLSHPGGVTKSSFGEALAPVDIDCDGGDELAIGAPDQATVFSAEGAVWVVSASGFDEIQLPARRDAKAGRRLAHGGDMDSDGCPDLLVGAYGTQSGGTVYLVPGSPDSQTGGELASFTLSDARSGDTFGYAVSSAGDTDGDGVDEFLVGAPGYAAGGGAFHVSSATAVPVALDAAGLGSGDSFGYAVAGGTDLDDDGYDDLAVGAVSHADGGGVWLYRGGPDGVEEWQTVTPGPRYSGAAFGSSLAMHADVDGDGVGDILVGAPAASDVTDHGGAAFLYHGTASGLIGQDAIVPAGSLYRQQFGESLVSLSDESGRSGFVIGGPGDIFSAPVVGAVWLAEVCTDADLDGTCAAEDCDDGDPDTWPGAAGFDSTTACMQDSDGDGFGQDTPSAGVSPAATATTMTRRFTPQRRRPAATRSTPTATGPAPSPMTRTEMACFPLSRRCSAPTPALRTPTPMAWTTARSSSWGPIPTPRTATSTGSMMATSFRRAPTRWSRTRTATACATAMRSSWERTRSIPTLTATGSSTGSTKARSAGTTEGARRSLARRPSPRGYWRPCSRDAGGAGGVGVAPPRRIVAAPRRASAQEVQQDPLVAERQPLEGHADAALLE